MTSKMYYTARNAEVDIDRGRTDEEFEDLWRSRSEDRWLLGEEEQDETRLVLAGVFYAC